MRGLQYHGHKDIRFSTEVAEPVISVPDELIIDVAYCGLCGSDLHEYLDGPIFFSECNGISGNGMPQCMGHEMSGVVKSVGEGVTKFKAGDRVVVETTGSCQDRYRFKNADPKDKDVVCSACKAGQYNLCSHIAFMGLGVHDGAFSERVVASERHVVKIPDHVPLDVAALIEPLSVAWHAVEMSGIKPGQSALVIGSGPIGLATVLALQGHEAGEIVVSEPAAIRRAQAEKFGVQVYNPMEHKDAVADLRALAPGGEGFNASFDCSGLPITFKTSIEALTFRGTAVNVAIWGHKPVDFYPMDVTLKERFVTGSLAYTVDDFRAVVAAMDSGKISVDLAKNMITGKQNIKDGVEKGIMELINNKENNIKILLTPNNNGELDA